MTPKITKIGYPVPCRVLFFGGVFGWDVEFEGVALVFLPIEDRLGAKELGQRSPTDGTDRGGRRAGAMFEPEVVCSGMV